MTTNRRTKYWQRANQETGENIPAPWVRTEKKNRASEKWQSKHSTEGSNSIKNRRLETNKIVNDAGSNSTK